MDTKDGHLKCQRCKLTVRERETEVEPKVWVGTLEACPYCGEGYEPQDFIPDVVAQ